MTPSTAIEAFRKRFNFSPSPGQQRAAKHNHYGGNEDPATIASIGMQAEKLFVRFFLENGRVPTPEDIAKDVDLRSWGPWVDRNGRTWPGASEGAWSRPPQEVVLPDVALIIVWWLYTHNLQRTPDVEGSTYWLKRIFVLLDALHEMFRDGVTTPEDRERLEKAMEGNT